MSGFKVHLEGLEVFKKQLKTNSSLDRMIPDMSTAVMKFHNTMERRVGEVFSLKDPLSSVMIGRSVKPEKLGNTLLRFSLQYRYQKVDMSSYRTIVDSSTSISSAPIAKKGFTKWTKGQHSKRVSVQIRKGKTLVARAGQNYRKKGFMVKDKLGRDQIAYRVGKTWSTYPTKGLKGKRAMYKYLYGPSLSRLAEIAYEKDPVVAQAKETLTSDILKSFNNFYD